MSDDDPKVSQSSAITVADFQSAVEARSRDGWRYVGETMNGGFEARRRLLGGREICLMYHAGDSRPWFESIITGTGSGGTPYATHPSAGEALTVLSRVM
ncbi:MAG TPA: hypothetical protein VGH44_05940 [Candidatus Saccharimonadia bacterium]|jgi:hypothetical protein